MDLTESGNLLFYSDLDREPFYYHLDFKYSPFQVEFTRLNAELPRILPPDCVESAKACMAKFKRMYATGKTPLWEMVYRFESDGTYLEQILEDILPR